MTGASAPGHRSFVVTVPAWDMCLLVHDEIRTVRRSAGLEVGHDARGTGVRTDETSTLGRTGRSGVAATPRGPLRVKQHRRGLRAWIHDGTAHVPLHRTRVRGRSAVHASFRGENRGPGRACPTVRPFNGPVEYSNDGWTRSSNGGAIGESASRWTGGFEI